MCVQENKNCAISLLWQKSTQNFFEEIVQSAFIVYCHSGSMPDGSVTFCLVQVRLVHFCLVHFRLDNILPR